MTVKYWAVFSNTKFTIDNPSALIRVTSGKDIELNEYKVEKFGWRENDDFVYRHLFVSTPEGTADPIESITEEQAKKVEAMWD